MEAAPLAAAVAMICRDVLSMTWEAAVDPAILDGSARALAITRTDRNNTRDHSTGSKRLRDVRSARRASRSLMNYFEV